MVTLKCYRQLVEEVPVHWAGPVWYQQDSMWGLIQTPQFISMLPPSHPALAGLWFGGQLPLPLLLHHFVKLHGGFGVLHRRVAPLPSLRTQESTSRGVFKITMTWTPKNCHNWISPADSLWLIWISTTCWVLFQELVVLIFFLGVTQTKLISISCLKKPFSDCRL